MSPSFRLVPASAEDGRQIWRWRNEAAARRNSPDPSRIPLARHMAWLRGKLADPACALLIARDLRGRPLGQLRVDLAKSGDAVVSIVVDRAARGRGVGSEMLRRIPHAIGGRPIRRLVAFVKPDNVASVLAFVRAGFRFSRFAEGFYRLEKPGRP